MNYSQYIKYRTEAETSDERRVEIGNSIYTFDFFLDLEAINGTSGAILALQRIVEEDEMKTTVKAIDALTTNKQTTSGSIKPISAVIRERIKESGKRFWANDSVAEFIKDGEKQLLIDELTSKFESVLDSLLIDRETDPNSHGTGKRMAKMYVNEIMGGRYVEGPDVTAFPNDDIDNRFAGVLVTQTELKSMCSHHHQPVTLMCYIGIIPSTKMIGLSKYSRVAQHLARRGTLQEELTKEIADEIIKQTGSHDVAVVCVGTHGCCENRGIMAHNSATYTAVLNGQFHSQGVKDEFFQAIERVKTFKCN